MKTRLSNDDYEYLKAEGVALLEHCHVSCYPYYVYTIVRKVADEIIPYSRLKEKPRRYAAAMTASADAFCIMKNNGRWSIYYNDDQSELRCRFTMMHEAGHIWLNHIYPGEIAEAQANFFARFCLAPPVLVHHFQCEYERDVASHFRISDECARHAWNHYQGWLNRPTEELSDSDIRLCNLLNISTDGKKHRR